MAFQLCRGIDDAPPWRPPSSMLALLASEQFSDKDVVDLRPTVGAASCYPRLARSVTALSHSDNASFCEELEAHASTIARRTRDALASSAFGERPPMVGVHYAEGYAPPERLEIVCRRCGGCDAPIALR